MYETLINMNYQKKKKKSEPADRVENVDFNELSYTIPVHITDGNCVGQDGFNATSVMWVIIMC